MTKLFIDSEFTGLHKETTLISLGIVSDKGHYFYAEFTDYDKKQVTEWIQENVINNLILTQYFNKTISSWESWDSDEKKYTNALEMELANRDMSQFRCIGSARMITNRLIKWLSQFEQIEIWSDCLAYDWVLFCDLFGGAFQIPKNIHYIPNDLATLFLLKCGDNDINRVLYAGVGTLKFIQDNIGKLQAHNSLYDAIIIRDCYEQLIISPCVNCKS